MAFFGMGKKPDQASAGSDTPLEQVMQMRQSGQSNSQIVQSLQRAGFKPHQIFDAMNQADMTAAGPVPQPDDPTQDPFSQQFEQAPAPDQFVPQQFDQQPTQQPQYVPPQYPPQQQQQSSDQGIGQDRVEELVEQIIDEKWTELMKNINKIIEWKNSIESRMAVLEQRFKDLKGNVDSLQAGVVDKINDYDQSVQAVGTDIKAMEQVFQKVLPTLTDNVNELSRITKGIKDAKK